MGRRLTIPLCLLATWAVVQGHFLRAPWPQDALTYFEDAAAFPDVDPDHWSLRVGIVLPLRVLQMAFGESLAAYYALPLLASAVLVLATWWIGARLFDHVVGIGAALIVLVTPVFLDQSSAPLPDHVSTALAAVAIALVLYVADQPPSRRTDGLLVVAGLLFGWAYLVREFIVLLLPMAIVILRAGRAPWPRLLWIAVPAAAVFVGECVLNAIVHGAPFIRLTDAGSHGGQLDDALTGRLDALLRMPRVLRDAKGGLPLAAMTLLAPALLFIRQRAFRLLGAWFLLFWVPITLGNGLIVPDFRFLVAPRARYWTPILPAVAIGGVGLLWTLAKHRPPAPSWLPNALVGGFSLAAVVVGWTAAEDRPVYRSAGAHHVQDIRSWLDDEGGDIDTIRTDTYTTRLAPLFSHTTFGDEVWHGRVDDQPIDTLLEFRDADHTAVVFHRFDFGRQVRGFPGFDDDPPDPPSGWELALRQNDDRLVIYRTVD